jgi:hypothetical protein
MASLFQGDPLKAPSYAATTTDVPQWLQDYTVDLFSQQRAVSGTPYTPYTNPLGRIAQTTAPTTQAQNLITSSVGAYQPAMQNAIAGTQGLTGQGAGTTAGLGYLQQAAGMSGSAAAQPLFNQATGMATQAGGINTATPLNMTQGQYTNPNLATQNLNLGQNALAQSGQTATANIGAYMNPYTQNVTDQIASLGARNLSENLLPAVSDQFIRAGQFGSSGMGTFGGRALRDTQEAILNQQNQALQAGYGQALGASQADLARQAQLGQTYTQAGQAQQATGIGAAQAVAGQQASDAARQMAAAQELGTIGQQTGALTQAGQQNLGTIGAQTAATAQAEAARQQAAQQQVADLAKMQQGLTTADAAALESVGAAQQQQTQRQLDVAYQDYQNQLAYPQNQINAMSTTLRGLPANATPTASTQSGYTTTFSPSPLSDIASAYGVYKGLTAPKAKGGLIQGYAAGGAVSGGDDNLLQSVMSDYGQYINPGYAEGGTAIYDQRMALSQPAYDQGKADMAARAAYYAAHPAIGSPDSPTAINRGYTNATKNYNTAIDAYNKDNNVDIYTPKEAYYSALDKYLMSNSRGYNPTVYSGLTAARGTRDENYRIADEDGNDYSSADADYRTQLDELAKTISKPVGKSPWGNAMPHLAHGGRVPGYAEEGYVDTENPADLVDGGQGFADQYAQGQQDYPAQQDAAVYQGQGPGPIIGREALNALVTKYGGLGDDAIRQLAEINTQRTAARNDYNTQIAKLEAMQPQGPSESEKWLNFAAAFADPGKTGSFGEGMGHAATSLAAHRKSQREYDQEFMKNRIMAGLKRGEFTMEDLARQEKSTVDMAQLGINSQEKLAALLEKVNGAERARLSGIIVHWNDANSEITSVDKSNNTVTTLRVADIPESIYKEIYSNAQARAEQYLPEDKPAKIEQFMKENLEAYAKTRTAVKLGDTAPLQLAPTSTTTGSGAPSHTGSTITPATRQEFQGDPNVTMKELARIPNEAEKIVAGAQFEQHLNKANAEYTSPFGQYVVAPPRARITTGEQTPQQKIEFEGQAAANLDEVKLFNTRVNEASSAGAEGVAAANQLLAVLPKIPNTGTLAPYRQQLGSVFGSLGIPGDITDSASMLGIAQAAVSGSVLGKQLLQKGVQTEGDAKRMEAAGPTLTQPKVAIEFLTRTAKASGLRQLEMSAFRDDWRRKNQSDLGMGDAWNRYLNDTPMTALMPNNKLMFVNEYVDQYMKAHPEGTPEQRRGAALNDWRKLGGM